MPFYLPDYKKKEIQNRKKTKSKCSYLIKVYEILCLIFKCIKSVI